MRHLLLNIFFILIFILTPVIAEEVISKKPLTEVVETEKKPAFIPLSQVPDEAVKTQEALKKIEKALNSTPKVNEIHTALPAYMEALTPNLNGSKQQNLEALNLRKLQKMRYEWRIYNEKLQEWEKTLKESITINDEVSKELEEYSTLWSETHINANEKSAPESIQNYIANVIIAIEKLRNASKTQYDALLTDTNICTSTIAKINEKSDQLLEAEETLSKRIFFRDQAPLSEALREESFTPYSFFSGIYRNLLDKSNEFKIYYSSNQDKKIIALLIALGIGSFISYFYWLYRQRRLFVKSISQQRKAFYFIKRPLSTFVLLIALVNVAIFNDQPQAVKDMILFIIFIPMLRIIQTVIHKKTIPYFYLYFGLFFLDMIDKNAMSQNLDERIFIIFINLSMIILIIFFIKNKVIDSLEMGLLKTLFYRFLPLIILLMVGSIIANTYGTVLLSLKLTHGVFIAIHASIVFYALTIILSGYTILLLRRRIALVSNLLDKYADSIERNVTFAIKFVMVIWWFKIIIRILGYQSNFDSFIEETLALSWVVGTTTISVHAIVSFILILIGTWVLSKTIQIFLEVELFSRVKFSRGVPTAISTVSNYIIIISGLLIAVSSLGITTQQLALIFGALGVGIGFGLRNIIANFISGVIMVFERPIQIGDTIEVDNTMGKVIHIGTRASSIKTFDGSEVIVPNESFISSKIINWTLSDERRRKTLNIKVAFESDIETVLEIMRDVALTHESVLKDPAPLPTFQGFGDYYLEFKLYYWLADNLIVAESDIAIGVYKQLKTSNIATPMPVQELIMPQVKE